MTTSHPVNMKRLQKYSALLAAVQAADPKTRVGILRSAPDEFIKTLLEVVLNLLAGNIPYTKKIYNKLRRHKTQLRNLRSKQKGSVANMRRSFLKQKGGFLPFLLAPLIAGGIATAAAAPAIARSVATSATDGAIDTVEKRAKGYIDKL